MTWLVLLAVGVGSYALRVGPLLVLERTTQSPALERAIRHGGVAAIAALIALSTLDVAAAGDMVPALLAVGAGVGLAARGVPMLRLLVVGGALYALAAVVGDLLAR